MNNVIFENSILVELPIPSTPAAGQQLTFNDVPLLRGKKIYGIICHLNGVDYTKSTTGNDIIDATKAKGSVLTLSTTKSDYPVYQLPIYDLSAVQNAGEIRLFNDIPLDITKSYITIIDSSTMAQNDTFAFTFLYH